MYYLLVIEDNVTGHSYIVKLLPQDKPRKHDISIPFDTYEGMTIAYKVLRYVYLDRHTQMFPYTCTQLVNLWLDITSEV